METDGREPASTMGAETADPDPPGTPPAPPLLRPVPRRPFAQQPPSVVVSPPPPPASSPPASCDLAFRLELASSLQLLRPRSQGAEAGNGDCRWGPDHDEEGDGRDGHDCSRPMSREASFENLTRSTLAGIYGPAILSSSFAEDDFDGGDEVDTSAGPQVRGGPEAAAPDSPSRSRTRPLRQRSSGLSLVRSPSAAPASTPRSRAVVAVVLVLRTALLFVLGVGYGLLVTRLPTNLDHPQQHAQSEGPNAAGDVDIVAPQADYGVRQSAFWGVAGVVLGNLLPWFDGIWEQKFGGGQTTTEALVSSSPDLDDAAIVATSSAPRKVTNTALGFSAITTTTTATTAIRPTPQRRSSASSAFTFPSSSAPPDWALVVRGIGAFVGIAFAIRKLPWASTMQVSLTLALANPILWYLMDRSRPGLVLATCAGLGAAAALLAGLVSPDVLPPPLTLASIGFVRLPHGGLGGPAELPARRRYSGLGAHAGRHHQQLHHHLSQSHHSHLDHAKPAPPLGVQQETIEAGIWLLSLLFCSCVVFGNIGRRLALNGSATAKGRWGGLK